MLQQNSSFPWMVNRKVEFPKDHTSLLNWTGELPRERETKDENGLELEFRKLIKTGSKSWVTDCKTYLGFKDIGLACTSVNQDRHHFWLGHRKPQHGFCLKQGRVLLSILVSEMCLPSQSWLAVIKGANATSLCYLLLTGHLRLFQLLARQAVSFSLKVPPERADFHKRQVWN